MINKFDNSKVRNGKGINFFSFYEIQLRNKQKNKEIIKELEMR